MDLGIVVFLLVEDEVSFDSVYFCPDGCSFDAVGELVSTEAMNVLGLELGSAATGGRHGERLDLM